MDTVSKNLDDNIVALIICAGRAARDDNIGGVISALTLEVNIFEERPSEVQALMTCSYLRTSSRTSDRVCSGVLVSGAAP